ncbi:MAG: Thiamine biosynthesis protein ThiS [uncultured bacterium]|nr:MAG: Thiamine biosynthesis protein ThiS [uncultured bacterium]
MQIKLNGKNENIENVDTITDLLFKFSINQKTVVVEVNSKITGYKDFDKVSLKEGDVVEIIRFMGGG